MSLTVETPTENPNPPKRKRGWRRLQFRLRAILLLTTLIAIWLGWWLHNARQQRETAAELRKAGATIEYDFQFDGSPFLHPEDRPPYWPAWLVDSLGVDCFADVSAVSLGNRESKVTDAGLQHLKDLTSLQDLALTNTQVTDAGLEHLKGLTSLQELYLEDTQVTDAGLEHLKDLNSLQYLHLASTEVTDAGLEHLKGLNALIWLNLDNTQVTDAGLEHLKGLTSLHELFLYDTQVTDAGLEHLKGLNALIWLNLDNTQVTNAGVARLQEALPNCQIEH